MSRCQHDRNGGNGGALVVGLIVLTALVGGTAKAQHGAKGYGAGFLNAKLTHGRACPVPNARFGSTFGAPRVGHRHQGTDLMAPAGSKVAAFEDGTVVKVQNRDRGTAGRYVNIRSRRGVSKYMHNSVNLVHVGQKVRAGQKIAEVGNTGNARHTASHTHWEYHPGGGRAVDPYPGLKLVCRGAQ